MCRPRAADGSPRGRRRLLLWNPPLANQPTPIPAGKGVPLAREEDAPESGGAAGGSGAGAAARADADGGDSDRGDILTTLPIWQDH